MLPESHTCYNTIDLPEYVLKEILYEKLQISLTEGL